LGTWREHSANTLGRREKWKETPHPPQNKKGKKWRHLECMLGPSHWLHEISLSQRLGHHFWLGLTPLAKKPYLFTVGAHLIFKKKTVWFFKHFRSRELPVLNRPKP
jgi:hypothetical protein